MRCNRWFKNIIHISLIALLLVIGTILLTNHTLQVKEKFEYNLPYITFIVIIFFGGIGILLELKNLIMLSKKKGQLKFDFSRLLILGIPSFIISITYIWGYLGITNIIPNVYSYLLKNYYIIIISNIILGHTIASSLYKE